MTEKEQKVKEFIQKYQEAKKFLEHNCNKKFEDYFLMSLLGHYFAQDDIQNFLIFHDDIDNINLKEILLSEINQTLAIIEFDSKEFDFLYSDKLEKATIKENGKKWIIHNDDKDTKPSKPHAHEYNLNVKLHLGTGEMYKAGKMIGKLSKNEFKRLLQKIEKKGINLPSQT